MSISNEIRSTKCEVRNEMKRRTFIDLSTFSAASVVVLLQNGCAEKAIKKGLGEPLSLSYILDAKTIRETGLAYREQFPSENNKKKLAYLLTNQNSLADNTDPRTIRSILDKKSQEDFENGKTVVVNGWVLSETEARQCALFSLLQS